MEEGTIKTRILTALVAIPILVLVIIFANRSFFNIVVLLVALFGLNELYGMTLNRERGLERFFGLIFGVLFAFFISWQQPGAAIAVLCFTFLLLSVVFLLRFRDLDRVLGALALTFFGILYVPFLLSHLALLRQLEQGREWVFMALIIAMAGDTAAYFVGSAVGRRKLYPAISPNKSIEGAVGGWFGSVLGALAFKFFMLPEVSFWLIVVMAGTLAILAQLGDLFESMLKRSCGVKDSGSIIPGHGGILDRLDSLLFVFPGAYYFVAHFV